MASSMGAKLLDVFVLEDARGVVVEEGAGVESSAVLHAVEEEGDCEQVREKLLHGVFR